MPATPTLPDHFDQEARLQFLYSFLNPNIDQFRVADLAGLKLSEYFAYINSEEFQERLTQQTSIAEQRARACATLAQPKAVATLTHIIDSYNEAERDILLGRQPIALNIRQRHRESARRASWLILKLTGAIPTHLRAARPRPALEREESDNSSGNAPSQRLDPSTVNKLLKLAGLPQTNDLAHEDHTAHAAQEHIIDDAASEPPATDIVDTSSPQANPHPSPPDAPVASLSERHPPATQDPQAPQELAPSIIRRADPIRKPPHQTHTPRALQTSLLRAGP